MELHIFNSSNILFPFQKKTLHSTPKFVKMIGSQLHQRNRCFFKKSKHKFEIAPFLILEHYASIDTYIICRHYNS